MPDRREELLERVTLVINALQNIQADSRTPLDAALAVVEPIRKLTDYRRAMRRIEFQIHAGMAEYQAAVSQLRRISDTLAADLVAHQTHMQHVALAAQAADAVLSVAIAVGAMAI